LSPLENAVNPFGVAVGDGVGDGDVDGDGEVEADALGLGDGECPAGAFVGVGVACGLAVPVGVGLGFGSTLCPPPQALNTSAAAEHIAAAYNRPDILISIKPLTRVLIRFHERAYVMDLTKV
jgi:hypothetical protein